MYSPSIVNVDVCGWFMSWNEVVMKKQFCLNDWILQKLWWLDAEKY